MNRERLYPWLVLSSSGAMVSGAIAMLILMLSTVIGPFRFGALETHEASRAVGFWVPVRPWTGDTIKRVQAWRAVVPRGELILEAESLPELVRSGIRVVVVPDGRRISLEEVAQLRRFVRGGGSVVLSGAVGVRERDGGWRGFEPMRELLQATAVQTLPSEQAGQLLPVRRGPLVASLVPDAVIAVRAEPGVPGVPATAEEELRWAARSGLAAARRRELGTGRMVWLAAGPEAELGSAGNPFVRLHHNALAWARRLPSVERLPWPGGRPFAALLRPGESASSPEAAREQIARAARRGSLVELQLPFGEGTDALRERLVQQVRQRGAWITDGALLEEWRRQREQLFVRLEMVTERRLLLRVSNEGEKPISDLVLRAFVNQPIERISIESVEILVDEATVGFQRGSEWADIALPEIGARVNRGFYLDFELPAI